MNADDLAMLGELTRQYRDGLEYLRRLARIPPEADVADIRNLLDKLSTDVGRFVESIQWREAMSWPDRNKNDARHPPNQWIPPLARPIESKDVEPDASVTRYDVAGDQVGTVRLGAPSLSRREHRKRAPR